MELRLFFSVINSSLDEYRPSSIADAPVQMFFSLFEVSRVNYPGRTDDNYPVRF